MKKSLKNKKLNKFCLYVGFFALVLFGVAYSFGEVKAVELLAYEYMPVSGASNYNNGSYADYNKSFDFSFVASTTNITKFDTWLFRSDSATANGTWCSYNYNDCGASDFATLSIYSDISRTELVAMASLLWSDIQLCSDGNTSDYMCQGWIMANTQPATVFIFDTPVALTVSDTYYITITSTAYVGMGFKNWNSDYAYRAYYDDAYSASDDYILYYGDEPYYQEINEPVNIPFVYNICDTWDSENSYSVRLVDSEDNDILENNKILSSCSGSNFVYPFSYDEEFSDDVRIIIFDDEDNIIVESEEFSFSIYTLILSNEAFIFYTLDNPLYINTDLGTGTEPVAFSYNVCDDVDFASSTFILKDISNNIETEYTFTPTECYGNTYINIPYNQYMNLTFPAQIIYKNDDEVLLESSVFQLVFYSNQLTDLTDLDDETATSTNIILNFATTQINKLKNIFPFNFPVAIITAWDNSKTESLDSSLDFLDMSESDGSLTATFPKEWALTDEDLEFDFFSEDMITQGSSKAEDFFASFKEFTKWLQYFLFAWAVIYFSRKIINDLTENKSDDV